MSAEFPTLFTPVHPARSPQEDRRERESDSLGLAAAHAPEDGLTKAPAAWEMEIHASGDAVSARPAATAFDEARKLAPSL